MKTEKFYFLSLSDMAKNFHQIILETFNKRIILVCSSDFNYVKSKLLIVCRNLAYGITLKNKDYLSGWDQTMSWRN